MDLLGNDELQVTPDLPIPESDSSIFTYRNLVVILLLFVIMLVISNIKNSTKILAKAMRRIKISNLDQLKSTDKSDFKSYATNTSDGQSLISSTKKPVHVKLFERR